ncbi:PREDICTED: isochorismatase domain-containing protein 1-like [Chinchilla lanigera]|uniref:isochorismatase domain-containing protein 1-like n=1 Tax=Chinchilla lanigera TaxID=34839 RepID=UPI0006982B2F|nr:PREDICTED: isochorismatase domain-containing protein 1-like [Chinchilla lanigera]
MDFAQCRLTPRCPHSMGYELPIQKFLTLYSSQMDTHCKFIVLLFSEEWGQCVDLLKRFEFPSRRERLVPGNTAMIPLNWKILLIPYRWFCCINVRQNNYQRLWTEVKWK